MVDRRVHDGCAVKGKCYRLLYECDKIKTFQIVGTSFALFPLIWAKERIMQPRKGPIQNEFTAYFDREGCIRQIWDRNESGHVWGKKCVISPCSCAKSLTIHPFQRHGVTTHCIFPWSRGNSHYSQKPRNICSNIPEDNNNNSTIPWSSNKTEKSNAQ